MAAGEFHDENGLLQWPGLLQSVTAAYPPDKPDCGEVGPVVAWLRWSILPNI